MTNRPLAIAAVCVLGGLAVLVTVALVAFDFWWAVPPSPAQRFAALGAAAVLAAALAGMWRMRRWGVYLIGAALVVRIVYGAAAHLAWSPPSLIGPAAILAVGLYYLRAMR